MPRQGLELELELGMGSRSSHDREALSAMVRE